MDHYHQLIIRSFQKNCPKIRMKEIKTKNWLSLNSSIKLRLSF